MNNGSIHPGEDASPRNFTSNYGVLGVARSRYLWIGVLGVLLNGISIVYLAVGSTIRRPLRVTLAGLSLNDLVFNVDLVLLSQPGWTVVSQTTGCWTVTYVMVSAVVTSYFLTAQLSAHNYLVVFRPFRCHAILSVRRCMAGMVGGVVSGYLLSLACLWAPLSFEPGLPCFVLAVVPRGGLAVGCCLCLASSAIIIALNLKVCWKIRRRKRAVHSDLSVRHVRLTRVFSLQTNVLQHEPLDAHLNPTKRICECKVIPAVSSVQPILNPESSFPILQKPFSERVLSETKNLTRTHLRTKFNTNENLTQVCTVTEQGQMPVQKSAKCCNSNNINDKSKVMHDAGVKENPCCSNDDNNPKTSSGKSKTEVNNAMAVNKNSSGRPRNGTSKTLVIMTWCSCFLTFPLIVEMIYGVIWVNDRVQFVTNWFGILVSSLLTIHGLTNPLLYAWRFISWRAVYQKMRHKIRTFFCNKFF